MPKKFHMILILHFRDDMADLRSTGLDAGQAVVAAGRGDLCKGATSQETEDGRRTQNERIGALLSSGW